MREPGAFVNHAARAAAFIAEPGRTEWHDQAVWYMRARRDRAAAEIPEWEALRAHAAAIKAHVLARLDTLLEQFAREAEAAGATVHWARDAAEHNAIVHGLLAARSVTRLVKSKSMLTEECGLNPYLAARGIDVVDTDLGERIMQLAGEPPSHIVMPAIHRRKEEVGAVFERHLGTPPGESDPERLTRAARADLRQRFLAADAALSGVNFAVAETGTLVIVTNEGNMDLGTALPPLHIASLGIEKLVPRTTDLPPFLRLLARSASGQPMSTYTTHLRGPRPGGELHIVLVDDGRSARLADPAARATLPCIRCAACMNTCPVFRRGGGHAYGTTVPGPIGILLAAQRDASFARRLPDACSVCDSCGDVCPVMIPLPREILAARARVVEQGLAPRGKRLALRLAAALMVRPRLYRFTCACARFALRLLPACAARALAAPWTGRRELPRPPRRSFQRAWRARDGRAR